MNCFNIALYIFSTHIYISNIANIFIGQEKVLPLCEPVPSSSVLNEIQDGNVDLVQESQVQEQVDTLPSSKAQKSHVIATMSPNQK